MAATPRFRIAPKQLSADREVLHTLQTLEGYSPTNPDASLAALEQLEARLVRAEEARVLAQYYYEVAIREAHAAQAAFHHGVLLAKEQVIGQYGGDSPEVHAVGRKRTSERKRPALRAKGPA